MVQPSILTSHKHSKMIETHFYRLYSIMNGSKSLLALRQSNARYFVDVTSVLLPMCCHIGSGIPYLCIFVEEVVALLGSMTDKWV